MHKTVAKEPFKLNRNQKGDTMQKEQKKQLQIDFTKAVHDYRDIIIKNFNARMGDEDDRKPLENKIIDLFKASPAELRIDFLLLILNVIGRPSHNNDADSSLRISGWLQGLAYDLFDELEKRGNFGDGETGNDKDITAALDLLLENHYWPKTLVTGQIYARRHDDTDGKDDPTQYLSLEIDKWGDAYVQIPPGKFRTLRFRMLEGGGQSERVRKALIILAEAIRRDNHEIPQT